ncbi:glycosyltransferase family 1 protein [soil metagenome]
MTKGLPFAARRRRGSAAVLPSGGVRILLDYRSALRNRTGVGEFTHSMAAALARPVGTSDQVTLFSSSWKDRLPPSPVPNASVIDRHIPVSVLNLAWHRAGWPPVEMLGGRADVAWSLHPLLMPSKRAAQVVTIYDLFFLGSPEETAREVRRDYPRLAADHARRADGIIVCSNYTRGQVVERLGVPPEKITVCWPGAPAWMPREAPRTLGPIVHIGTPGPRKNIAGLIHAYLEVAHGNPATPPLVLAGGTSPYAYLIDDADRALMETHVKRVGYVTEEQKLALYREASMVVMASLDEGFGIPALEAMTLGVPVVVSNRGALPEVVGDAGLLVDPEDRSAFAAAIGRVLDDADLRQTLSRLGPERSRLFDWNASAAKARHAFDVAVQRRQERR